MPDLTTKQIQTQEELDAVYRLTHDQYVAEGYSEPQPDGMLRHYKLFDSIPETAIFGVYKDEKLIGSVSLTKANMTGFPCDEDFPEEVAKIRSCSLIMGRRLANYWRLVTDPANSNLRTLLLLINAAVEDCCQHRVHEILFVVNPKHVSVYQKLLGMRIVAEKEIKKVQAPGVLLYADGRHFASKWIEMCEKRSIPTTTKISAFWWPTALS